MWMQKNRAGVLGLVNTGTFPVSLKASMNTPTYKYFIDFAAENKIPYIIIDGGWSVHEDLMRVITQFKFAELSTMAGQQRRWCYLMVDNNIVQQMDSAFPVYARMGVKDGRLIILIVMTWWLLRMLCDIIKKGCGI